MANVHALVRQRGPGINVRRIIVEIDQNVIALMEGEACGHEAQPIRGRTDKGDFPGFDVQQARSQFPRMTKQLIREHDLLVAQSATISVTLYGFSDAAR